MNFSTTNLSSTHTHHGKSEINFFLNDQNALTVTIDTNRLHIESVNHSQETYDYYGNLFGDKDVMSKFGTGETQNKEDIKTRINNVWVKRWQQRDPYSGLVVFEKDTDKFLGHVIIGHGDQPGQSELSYLFMKSSWGKGFGTEAVTAVVKEYAPATVKEGYTLEGETLKEIRATARLDNEPSIKILKKVGMHKIGEQEKYGAMRHLFSIQLSEFTSV